MAVLPFRTSTFARNIYQAGTASFTSIPAEYVGPVKQYAADKFFVDDIEAAAANGWITEAEKQETLDLKGPEDPQYRPVLLMDAPAPAEI